MLQRLIEKFRPWMEAMAELDDPRGEHLSMLERPVSRLEGKAGLSQDSDETGAGADVQEPRPNGFGGVNASIIFRRLG